MPDDEQVLSRPAAAPPRTLRYADGDTGVIDVWDAAEPRATVALVHGGFWKAAYDRMHLRPLANALASQGFSVASVEYARAGMPGGGWPGTSESANAALRAVLADERLGGAPVVAVGHSAGGHLVALAASEGGVEGLAGIVPLAGVLDLRLAGELDLGGGAAAALIGATRDLEPGDWAAADPVTHRLRAPAIVLHGTHDGIVPISLAHAWMASRTQRDARAKLIQLDGLGHYALIDPEHVDAFAALVGAVQDIAEGPARR